MARQLLWPDRVLPRALERQQEAVEVAVAAVEVVKMDDMPKK